MKRHKRENMSEPKDWPILARYLSGECSAKEIREVEAWMKVDLANERLVKLLQIVWNTPEVQSPASDVQKLWNKVAEKAAITQTTGEPTISETARPVSTITRLPFDFRQAAYRALRYAAIFLVLTSLTYLLIKNMDIFSWKKGEMVLQTLTVQNGDRQSITLHDGTNIVLDAGSMLKYPDNFTSDKREVFLNGEGYFEVTSNADKPFIVHANHAVVQVLGTKFNVRAWQPDQRVTVAVAEGKVSLRSEEGADREAVIINRGQSSTLPEGKLPSLPQPVDIKKHLGWIHNEVSFENAPLHVILYQLERWFDVQFVLADSSVAEERLTLHIENKTLEDILELINALTDLDYKQTGKLIRLKPRDVNEK